MSKTWTYVYYTEACSPKLKRFGSEKAAKRWVTMFLNKEAGNPDCWFNFMITGELVMATADYGGTADESYRVPRV